MKKTSVRWCAALLQVLLPLLAATGAQGALREEQLDVPVQVSDIYGKRVEQSIRVTVFSDDANPVPAPLIVLNHGRAAQSAERAAMGRARYSVASRFFVAQGFVVAVPTRIGYGVTGGEDVEASGQCGARRYAPAYEAGLAQTLRVLQLMRARPDVDPARAVIVGQSFGGTIAIAAAAQNPAGVVAAINFAGGGGGNPKTQPQRPCSPEAMERLFGQYGKTAHMPTLWIYTENDQYFGPTYPQEWFKAFREAGGKGEFTQFPPYGEDGHALFSRYPEVWQPRVRAFLEQVGLIRQRR